jgi:hypothetical protein
MLCFTGRMPAGFLSPASCMSACCRVYIYKRTNDRAPLLLTGRMISHVNCSIGSRRRRQKTTVRVTCHDSAHRHHGVEMNEEPARKVRRETLGWQGTPISLDWLIGWLRRLWNVQKFQRSLFGSALWR